MRPFRIALLIAASGSGGGSAVDIGSVLADDEQIRPSVATGSYALHSDGSGYYTSVIDGGQTFTWLLSGSAGNYQVRATITSGALSTGTAGSWLSLGSTQVWTVTRSAVGTSTCVLTMEIRRASDGVVLDTATITLKATVDIA